MSYQLSCKSIAVLRLGKNCLSEKIAGNFGYILVMPDTTKALRGILLLGAFLLGLVGISSIIDIRESVSSAGVIILTDTEANELTAVYGGIFLVLSALCYFASQRMEDGELVDFVAFAFLFVAIVRIYAIARHGWPDAIRVYFSLGSELFLGSAIFVLNSKFKQLRKAPDLPD